MRHPLLKPLLLVTIVLILPIALLATHGESFAEQLREWQSAPPAASAAAKATRAAAVVALLAADVFLPIPSGPISTLAGSQLGIVIGTAASCVGMTLGAAIAFACARRWGRPLAERLSSPGQLAAVDAAGRDHGAWMLIVTRPLPIVAEAAALLAGVLRMPWRDFLPPVIVANFALSAAYATLGSYAVEQGWMPLAVCATVAVPVAVGLWWGRTR